MKFGSKIPDFRGVFMSDTLPEKPWKNEKAIVNYQSNKEPGSHWVAYVKKGKKVVYFDSFGNLKPFKELVKYFRGCEIFYNHERLQDFGTYNCGHLCLAFLHKNS